MQKVTVRKLLVLHGGLVGLTADQARRRTHLLEQAEEQPEGLEDGFTVYGIKQDVQFKIGEELYVDSLDKVAAPLVSAATADKGDDSGADAASGDDGDDGNAKDADTGDDGNAEDPDAGDAGAATATAPTKKKGKKKASKKSKNAG